MMSLGKFRRQMKSTKRDREYAMSSLLVAAAKLAGLGFDEQVFREELSSWLAEEPGLRECLRELADLVAEVLRCDTRRN